MTPVSHIYMHGAGNQKQEWERAPSLDSINLKPVLDMQQQEQKKGSCVYRWHTWNQEGFERGIRYVGPIPFQLCRDNDNV